MEAVKAAEQGEVPVGAVGGRPGADIGSLS